MSLWLHLVSPILHTINHDATQGSHFALHFALGTTYGFCGCIVVNELHQTALQAGDGEGDMIKVWPLLPGARTSYSGIPDQ